MPVTAESLLKGEAFPWEVSRGKKNKKEEKKQMQSAESRGVPLRFVDKQNRGAKHAKQWILAADRASSISLSSPIKKLSVDGVNRIVRQFQR